ncbi:P-loop containing nucleoside triphosphate hydrolase protein [Baffinella frigidus]|nr:P-loop containing nucleoside triphosphate hydrolase protein [Cryptophyta sp. CCMP2293]
MSGEEGIQVFVRVRPQNKKETQLNRSAIEVDPAKSAVIVTNKQGDGKNQQFVYDQVGGPECTQEHVFNKVGQPLCEAVLQGFNSTIFAYGQTGSGKTHTMLGGEDSSDVSLAEGKFDTVVCKASYLEIYNEVVSDLLSDSASNIVIRDDPRKGVVIEGDSQMAVSSAADTLQALSLGSQNRRVAATCMNKESSRSHCCFALHVSTTVKVDGVTTRKYAKFNLIDLAGSERQKATNATGDRLKEANNINRSLSALGNVIMALANSNGHVPYRDSKLTFMLKDSIGGNSKTCIIANCSPAQECVDETLSTLKFVRFAKLVRNMATVNQESAGGLEALKREITRLKVLPPPPLLPSSAHLHPTPTPLVAS